MLLTMCFTGRQVTVKIEHVMLVKGQRGGKAEVTGKQTRETASTSELKEHARNLHVVVTEVPEYQSRSVCEVHFNITATSGWQTAADLQTPKRQRRVEKTTSMGGKGIWWDE